MRTTETSANSAVPSTTTAAGVDEVDVFDIAVGDCLIDDIVPDSGEGVSGDQKQVNCGAPHYSEVYASTSMTGSEFPGTPAVEAESEELCDREFTSFVGMSYEQSLLDLSYLYPTSDSWKSEDREILCLINDPAGDTVGSPAGCGALRRSRATRCSTFFGVGRPQSDYPSDLVGSRGR
ncbi:septum formation family protein [Rhodococcus erythropolis]|uniref:septum formation family protein n=1 Tax=Rhodococcus erythropolis TaxID=1833 RepID=UPI0035582FE4